ncbi:amidohydrolase [soil metagenome]
MFTTGFSMNAKSLAEEVEGPSMMWMQQVATALKSAVTGSLIIKEKKKFYNCFVWMNPDGTYHTYNKRHLFRMGGEDQVYTAGTESIVIPCKDWVICPPVCYDLRFPVWSRNRMVKQGKEISFDYDVLIYVANWPTVRRYHWQQLLIARAIENQAYVVGVNRIGKDGKENSYSGDSVMLDPLGNRISKTLPNKSAVETIVFSMKNLLLVREKFPVFYDSDRFEMK